jgi:hypothetical protein
MKKLFYLLSITFAFTFLFASCDKNDPKPQKETVVSSIDTLSQGFDVDGNLIYAKIQFKTDSVFTFNDIEYRDCIVEFYNDYKNLVTIIYDKDYNILYKTFSFYYDGNTIYNLTYEDIINCDVYWIYEYKIDGTYTLYDYINNRYIISDDCIPYNFNTQNTIDNCIKLRKKLI